MIRSRTGWVPGKAHGASGHSRADTGMLKIRQGTAATIAAQAEYGSPSVPTLLQNCPMSPPNDKFWETTPLPEMTAAQWEALCDGCAKCCLEKLEDEETRRIVYTNVACRLLDHGTCRCRDYANRSKVVPTCITLTPDVLADPYWLPSTCAYRLLAEGRPLPDWHPLVSGDPASVAEAGHRVGGWVISEDDAGPLVHHLIDWVD